MYLIIVFAMFQKIIIFILSTNEAEKYPPEIGKSLKIFPKCVIMMNSGEEAVKWLNEIGKAKMVSSFKRIY